MAIQYVDRTSSSPTTGTQTNLVVPANAVNKDVLLAFIDAAGPSAIYAALPAGWVELVTATGNGSRLRVAKRLVSSGEALTSSSFELTGASGQAIKRQVQVVAYRGVDYAALTPDSVEVKVETVSGTAHTTNVQNIAVANSHLVQHYQDRASITSPLVTPPGGTPTLFVRVGPIAQGGSGQITSATYDRGPVSGTRASETYTGNAATSSAIIASVQLAPAAATATGWVEVVPFRRT